MSQTNTPSGADVDLLAGIENAGAIGELLRERRWTRNYEAAAAKCDAELAKYPADDVARVAFEDALYVATCQFNKHFSKTYADNGLPPISTPELMHPAAVAALLARNAELEAERDALAAERDKQQDTSREWAQRASALAAENKALQSRLSGLADHCRRVYDIVPQLPIDERSMEGATDALHAFCIMLGVNGIDIDAARTPAAKENDDG